MGLFPFPFLFGACLAVPAETADYSNDYDKKTGIYKHIYRNAASLLVDGCAACPAVIKFTKPSTIVTRCLNAASKIPIHKKLAISKHIWYPNQLV